MSSPPTVQDGQSADCSAGELESLAPDARQLVEEVFVRPESPVAVSKHDIPDLALFLSGMRPASSVTTFAEVGEGVGSVQEARSADPVGDLTGALGIAHYTRSTLRDGVVVTTHYVANDLDRIYRHLLDDSLHHIRAKGRFLGYPESAVTDNLGDEAHGYRWNDFVAGRDPPTEQLLDLSVLPYVPAVSDDGYHRGVRRGRRYRRRLTAVAAEFSALAEQIEWRVRASMASWERDYSGSWSWSG